MKAKDLVAGRSLYEDKLAMEELLKGVGVAMSRLAIDVGIRELIR